jgi:BON domain
MPSARQRAVPSETDRGPDSAYRVDRRTDFPEEAAEIGGLRPPDADSLPTLDELDDLGEISDTRTYMGELEARPVDSDQPDEARWDNTESLEATEPRSGETDDPTEAAEEGLTWIPPTDPPVSANGREGPEIAAGFGMTSIDEPFDADHHARALDDVDERAGRVLDALRADAATSGLVDGLGVSSDGGRVVIEGTVTDLDDEDAVVAVAERATGVTSVTSRIRVASLEGSRDERPDEMEGSQ